MIVTFVGIDPGVVDTGFVVLRFDTVAHWFSVRHRVYHGVTDSNKGLITINPQYLINIKKEAELVRKSDPRTVLYVEGYRNRGKNPRQDQQMTVLVSATTRAVRGNVVDNTGIKKVVKPALMQLFSFRFPGTNHADLLSAARVALRGALGSPELNTVLSDFVRDALDGQPWRAA